ncbi:MAG TPA: thioredoxin domain-containing protein [Allosphingosinicella sp.]|jgi:protein-disulfide isomerase|nr:thioredoxin domain-containing protein [Allosphingosinicella sp.]
MKSMLAAGAAALTLILAGCGDGGGNASAPVPDAPLKSIAAPNNGDWTQTVSKTPDGGYRMGNPEAPVKLVEYGSLSCPHCAEFEEQGAPTLRDTYVKSGQVSWEFRTYLLFPTDPGVSLLLNCQSAEAFFPLVEQLYKDQKNWMGRIQSMPQEQLAALGSMAPRESAGMVVRAAGLDEFFRQRGMPSAQIQSCLADQAGLENIAAIKKKGDEAGVNGTPSFFINGKFYEGPANWKGLEPVLREAVG